MRHIVKPINSLNGPVEPAARRARYKTLQEWSDKRARASHLPTLASISSTEPTCPQTNHHSTKPATESSTTRTSTKAVLKRCQNDAITVPICNAGSSDRASLCVSLRITTNQNKFCVIQGQWPCALVNLYRVLTCIVCQVWSAMCTRLNQRRPGPVIYASVAVMAALCYTNSLHGDFVHDDIPAIVQNPDVLGTTSLSELFQHDFWGQPISDPDSHKSYRPITTLTFRANMWFSVHSAGFHLVNLALHLVVSLLVSSIVGRADVLCALFYLIAFFAFHRSMWSKQRWVNRVICLVVFVLSATLALLSKETGITVFAVCAFYWFFVCLHSPLTLTHLAPLVLPIFTLLLSFFTLLTIRLRLMGETWPYFSEQDNPASHSKSSLTRLLTYLYLAVFNLQLMLSPKQQAYDWQTSSIRLVRSVTDWRNVTTVCLLFGLLALLHRIFWRLSNGRPSGHYGKPVDHFAQTLLLSFLFLSMPYIPASNLFLPVGFVVAERLLYIPSIGLICLICSGIGRLKEANNGQTRPTLWTRLTARFSHLVLLALVLVFSLKTLQQNQVWLSRESLYKSGIANVPENAKAHYNYANLQLDMGNWNVAMRHYQTAIRLWPEHASAHNNLGALFWRIAQPEDAERHFTAALKINPYHAKAHFNLGKVYSKRGQTWEAIFLMERSLRLDRRFGESYEALATLYDQIGETTLAERFHLRALRLRPRNPDFYNNYGAFLQKTGRLDGALRQYRRALDLRPTHHIALLNLANLLSVLRQFDQAEHYYKRALKVKEDLSVWDSLGALYLRRSRLDLARYVYNYIAQNAPGQSLPKSVTIHTAQLLILEGHYEEAEAMLGHLSHDQQKHWLDLHQWARGHDPTRKSSGHLDGTNRTANQERRAKQQKQTSEVIDIHHQLALIYTLTNRTAEALGAIGKALKLCSQSNIISGEITTRCAQIYTLQGDVQKDLYQWPNAIESYKLAIELDQCLARAQLHLAVIYHLHERYPEAMLHYTLAQQLELGPNQRLIKENMAKLPWHHRRHLSLFETSGQMPSDWARSCHSRQMVSPTPATRIPTDRSFATDASERSTARLSISVTSTSILSSL